MTKVSRCRSLAATAGIQNSFTQIGGTALNGSYFTNHYSPYDTDPKVQKFVNDYKARYSSIPDALAATAYDAAQYHV